MTYLSDKFDIKSKFLISIHDEIRFLVRDEDVERAALALQVSNLWTRAMFASRLGMDGLPLVRHKLAPPCDQLPPRLSFSPP